MEHKLRKTINPILQDIAQQASVKKPIDLPLVNICCISAVGFYRNLVQPNTVTFTTSLYKINRIIKGKESELSGQESELSGQESELSGQESELIDKELVE